MLAAVTYFGHAFDGMRPASDRVGTLAHWQLRRATEIMSAVGDNISLKELASQCDLSVSYFGGRSKYPQAIHRIVGCSATASSAPSLYS
jgi:hypothetical protein